MTDSLEFVSGKWRKRRPAHTVGATFRGSPSMLGMTREPEYDRLLKKRKGWEVWRTQEGDVLVALPPGCNQVLLTEIHTARGTILACLDPPGVVSVWPRAARKVA